MSRYGDLRLVTIAPLAQSSAMPEWNVALHQWRQWLTAAGRPPSTIKLRAYQVRRFSRFCGSPWKATTQAMVEWLAGQPWGLETRRSHRAALISFYAWAQAVGHMSTNPAALLPPVTPAQHFPRPAPEQIVADAITAAPPRVRLMLMLAAHQGLRRAEIARVHTDDVQPDPRGFLLTVYGKGARIRLIPLADPIARAILAHPRGFVFPGQDSGHLSPAYVGKLMSAALPEHWTAHTLRHRFATRAYAGSRDLLAVQALLGHAQPETTKRYVDLPHDAMRSALGFAA